MRLLNSFRAAGRGAVLVLVAFASPSGLLAQEGGDARLSAERRAAIADTVISYVATQFGHLRAALGFHLERDAEAYRQEVRIAAGRAEFDLATLAFLSKLKNGHTWFIDPWLEGERGSAFPFLVSYLDHRWIVTESHESLIKAGSVITSVDGIPTEAVYQGLKQYIPASSDRGARIEMFRTRYLFPPNLKLGFDDGGQLTIDRAKSTPIEEKQVEGRWLQGDDIAYVKIPSFQDSRFENAALELLRQFSTANGLVIDVRGNVGGNTPVQLLRALVGRFRWWAIEDADGTVRPASTILVDSASRETLPFYGGRIVILVDQHCASACEDFLMPFVDRLRAPVVGDTTFGSTGQPAMHRFSNGMYLGVGKRRVRFPDTREFEGIGISPTTLVRPTRASLHKGQDPQLAHAIRILKVAIKRPAEKWLF